MLASCRRHRLLSSFHRKASSWASASDRSSKLHIGSSVASAQGSHLRRKEITKLPIVRRKVPGIAALFRGKTLELSQPEASTPKHSFRDEWNKPLEEPSEKKSACLRLGFIIFLSGAREVEGFFESFTFFRIFSWSNQRCCAKQRLSRQQSVFFLKIVS